MELEDASDSENSAEIRELAEAEQFVDELPSQERPPTTTLVVAGVMVDAKTITKMISVGDQAVVVAPLPKMDLELERRGLNGSHSFVMKFDTVEAAQKAHGALCGQAAHLVNKGALPIWYVLPTHYSVRRALLEETCEGDMDEVPVDPTVIPPEAYDFIQTALMDGWCADPKNPLFLTPDTIQKLSAWRKENKLPTPTDDQMDQGPFGQRAAIVAQVVRVFVDAGCPFGDVQKMKEWSDKGGLSDEKLELLFRTLGIREIETPEMPDNFLDGYPSLIGQEHAEASKDDIALTSSSSVPSVIPETTKSSTTSQDDTTTPQVDNPNANRPPPQTAVFDNAETRVNTGLLQNMTSEDVFEEDRRKAEASKED